MLRKTELFTMQQTNYIKLWVRPWMPASAVEALNNKCPYVSKAQIAKRASQVRDHLVNEGDFLDYRDWPRYKDTPKLVLDSQKARAEVWGQPLEQVQRADEDQDRKDWLAGKYTYLDFEHTDDQTAEQPECIGPKAQ